MELTQRLVTSLCLACNNLYANPEINVGSDGYGTHGFSPAARKSIRRTLAEWAFKDGSISMYDDEEDVKEILGDK